jgi:hypothetical protein
MAKKHAVKDFYPREMFLSAVMLGERLGLAWANPAVAQDYAEDIRGWLRGDDGAQRKLQTALPEDIWQRLVRLREKNPHLLEGLLVDLLDGNENY